MTETIATWLVTILAVYLGLGALFAVPFVILGAGRIDPQARGGSPGFRLVIVPGCVALWPLLARRWMKRSPPPEERNPHRDLARAGDRR